ncbi:MAG: cell division protein FtsQ/DivIB [Pseudomonadota bacterium]
MQPLSFPSVGGGHDPSPSRLRYKLQRWWLTPYIRSLIRTGVPTALVVFGTWVWVSNPDNAAILRTMAADAETWVKDRPEFSVEAIAIEGASPETDTMIREALGLRLPFSLFDFDAPRVEQTVMTLPPVARVRVQLQPGGILGIKVTERTPAFAWRHPGGLSLLDAEGVELRAVDARSAAPDLPLVAGEGAEEALAEAGALYEAATLLGGALVGLLRVGGRRWDVVISDGPRILLPAEGAAAAMARVIVLNETQNLMERDISHIDLRDPARPIVRLSSSASHVELP